MNTLDGENHLPDDLVSRAQQRLIRQGHVPDSPGISFDQEICLCSGAIVVREAIALRCSEEAADRFEREVTIRDSDYIRSVGCEVGLDGEMVGNIIMLSDQLPAHARLAGMLSYLDRLQCSDQ